MDSSASERGLWAAVVLQAADDLDCEEYGSVDYEQSVCFFLNGGDWGKWRSDVALMINVHANDLSRLGRARIAARTLRDPPPPPKPRPLIVPPKPRPSAVEYAENYSKPIPPRPKRIPRPLKPTPAPVSAASDRKNDRKPDWRTQPSNAWLVKLIAF
jgi:hypothetical protein